MNLLERNFFVNWYEDHGRDFPWRQIGVSPFALLVTEMLLRQTQAGAVSKLWHEFFQRYPDAQALAQADKNVLFTHLKVLGLAEQRSLALISAASWLVEHHGGEVPDSSGELIKIPHVGMYVVNAVLCFAFKRDIEIVDTNVLRFYARYYGLAVKPDIRRNPEIWGLAKASLPPEEVQEHNYGLLDFTAEICRTKMPRCPVCPLATSCTEGLRVMHEHSPNAVKARKSSSKQTPTPLPSPT
jgi:A/G-specific adenine glycosylase